MSESEIVDNTALQRFELHGEGDTAFLRYSKTGNSLRLIHTEVPDALRGQGVGSKLVGGVLRLAQQNKLRVIPSCPFVIDFLKRHSEYSAIIDSSER